MLAESNQTLLHTLNWQQKGLATSIYNDDLYSLECSGDDIQNVLEWLCVHESAVSQHGVHESAVGVNHNAQPADYFPTLYAQVDKKRKKAWSLAKKPLICKLAAFCKQLAKGC